VRECVCVCLLVLILVHRYRLCFTLLGDFTLLYRDPCRFLMGVDDEVQTAVSCNGYIGSPLPIPY
jgi:hypothetical protein